MNLAKSSFLLIVFLAVFFNLYLVNADDPWTKTQLNERETVFSLESDYLEDSPLPIELVIELNENGYRRVEAVRKIADQHTVYGNFSEFIDREIEVTITEKWQNRDESTYQFVSTQKLETNNGRFDKEGNRNYLYSSCTTPYEFIKWDTRSVERRMTQDEANEWLKNQGIPKSRLLKKYVQTQPPTYNIQYQPEWNKIEIFPDKYWEGEVLTLEADGQEFQILGQVDEVNFDFFYFIPPEFADKQITLKAARNGFTIGQVSDAIQKKKGYIILQPN